MAATASNPFTPTFGKVPFALAGRTDYIDDVIGGLANQPGDPYRSVVFYGPRGSGKTVLMEAIAREASGMGWVYASAPAREGLFERLFWDLRRHASHLLAPASKSRLVSLTAGPVAFTREIDHPHISRSIQLSMLVEELNEHGIGALFTIDEADPKCAEFQEFISAYQFLVREDRDVALLISGLPGKVSSLLDDESISFIRRAFQRPLRPISDTEVEQALLATIEGNGRRIDPDALSLCAEATSGYAYAIQVVGYYLWRDAPKDRDFNVKDAEHAVRMMHHEMERSVFIPTLLDLRQREEDYLRAMAQDEGRSSTSEVAKRMGISMTNASNLRRRLIQQCVITEIRMGTVDFDIPLLKDYLRSKL